MQLADIAGSIRRYWKISVAVMAASIVILGIFLVTRDQVRPPARYEAAVQILIPALDADGLRPEGVPPVLLQGQLSLALNPDTMQRTFAQAKLSAEDAEDIELGAGQSDTLDIMTLSARASDLDTAERVANAYAEIYISARSSTVGSGAKAQKDSIANAIKIYSARIADIETLLDAAGIALPEVVEPEDGAKEGDPPLVIPMPEGASVEEVQLITTRNTLLNAVSEAQIRAAQAEIESLTPAAFATIVERSSLRVTPPVPTPLIPAAVALGVGLLLAVAVPLLMDRLDHTITDRRTAAAVFRAPVLSTIPATSEKGYRSLAPPGSAHDLAFRSLAVNSIATDRLPRAIMVTSPSGRTQDMVAANFAAALAGLGLRVALIGTRPSQSWYPNATTKGSQAITFPDLLERAHRGTLNGEVEHRLAISELANLVIVPPGTDEDCEFPLDGLPPLLTALEKANVDVTVIAGPSLLDDPNATIFAWATRSVLWAVESGEVTRADALEAAERMELAGVTPFGVTMVGRHV